jgi:hypothetical protein
MSKLVPFPGTRRLTLSCLDRGVDGLFVLSTDENGKQETIGPFAGADARDFAVLASARGSIRSRGRIKVDVDLDSFPYTPDPRNGEVWVPEEEGASSRYVNGEWIELPSGFCVIHMSSGGGSAGGEDGFATLEEAKAAAVRIARQYNAVLLT